jgi:hypothetical protein
MRYEIDLFGVMMPALLLWLIVAYALTALLRLSLKRTGLYRHLWHRALFDAAAFVCLLGGIVYLSSEYLS